MPENCRGYRAETIQFATNGYSFLALCYVHVLLLKCQSRLERHNGGQPSVIIDRGVIKGSFLSVFVDIAIQ